MYLHLQRILKEVSSPKRMDPPKKINDQIKKITKDLSPRTIRKNISIENFMKYQWSWTL